MPKLGKNTSYALGRAWNAMAGDMTMDISPTTVGRAATDAVWTRNVEIAITDTEGRVHDWLTKDFTTTASIADTSSAGAATIASTTLSVVNGKASITVSGDAQDWLGGVAQEKSITNTAAPTSSGNITMTITAANMTDSPLDVVVALVHTVDTTVTLVADKIVDAFNADATFSAFFTADNTAGAITITAITPAANDATMDIAFVDTGTTGATFGASADTTAGVAKDTDTLTIANLTIMGYTVTGGTSVQTFS